MQISNNQLKKGSLNMKNSVSLLKKIFSGVSVIGALIHSGYAEDLKITLTNGQTEVIPWSTPWGSEILDNSKWQYMEPNRTPGKEIKKKLLIYRNRISHVVIPSRVKIIAAKAFACCTNLKSVTIPKGVIKISSRAFECCIGLESIEIPSTVTTVEFEAFAGCSNLRNVTFNGTTPSIGSAVFLGCKSLESVVGSDGEALALPSHAFFGCKRWAGKYGSPCEPTVKIKACLSDRYSLLKHKLDVRVPEACIGACPIRLLILEKALGSSFLTFRYRALSDIKNFLEEVNENGVGPGVSMFEWDTLMGRFSRLITSIEIVGDIETLCEQSFQDCDKLKSIILPQGLTTIGDWAFLRCENLTSIKIPSSVTTIGWGAFEGCGGLTTITLPQGLTTIGNRAFWGCKNLKSIEIPSSVTTIGWRAFWRCGNLESITLPSGVIQQGLGYIGINENNGKISIDSH